MSNLTFDLRAATSGAAMLELKYPFKVIEAMARYLYFAGHAALANLGPEDPVRHESQRKGKCS